MSHGSLLVALDDFPEPLDDAALRRAVAGQMAPFRESAEWFENGTRWDWYEIGGRCEGVFTGKPTIRRREVDLAAMRSDAIAGFTSTYQKAYEHDPGTRRHFFGIADDETLVDYLVRMIPHPFPGFRTFLHNRAWHEWYRLGWGGESVDTEPERRNPKQVRDYYMTRVGVDAVIFSYNADPAWQKGFYFRFIRDLPPSTLLVAVDYHI